MGADRDSEPEQEGGGASSHKKKARPGERRRQATKVAEEEVTNMCWICGAAGCQPRHCSHPDADEKREKRVEKRRQMIAQIKAKPHYMLYMQNVRKDQRTERSPVTPRAEDIYDIPTRMWKRETLKWDIQLKQQQWGLDGSQNEPEVLSDRPNSE